MHVEYGNKGTSTFSEELAAKLPILKANFIDVGIFPLNVQQQVLESLAACSPFFFD